MRWRSTGDKRRPPLLDTDGFNFDFCRFGPNGGLVFCLEHLVANLDWLKEQLDEIGEDECVLLDCPGNPDIILYQALKYALIKARWSSIRTFLSCTPSPELWTVGVTEAWACIYWTPYLFLNQPNSLPAACCR
jgi:hypothetical protein